MVPYSKSSRNECSSSICSNLPVEGSFELMLLVPLFEIMGNSKCSNLLLEGSFDCE